MRPANSLIRAPPISIDQVVSDFDGVTFHLSTPEAKTKILISLSVKCYRELLQYGAQQVLEREYGQYIVNPEAGYDFSILVDLENLPAEQGSAARASNKPSNTNTRSHRGQRRPCAPDIST